MQIVYTNLDGSTISFGQEAPFVITRKKGFGGVENIVTTQQQYGLDGSVLVNEQLDERDLEIEGELLATSLADVQEMRHLFSSVMNPKLAGVLSYYSDTGATYEIDVKIVRPPIIDEGAENLSQTFSVQFLALEAYWVDKQRSNELIPLSALQKNLTFPFRLSDGFTFAIRSSNTIQTIVNTGDIAIGMEIMLTMKADVVNPKVLNVGTSEFFRLKATYGAGTSLKIVTVRGKKEVTKILADGTEINALEDWDEESVFLQLERGTNFLHLQADLGEENMIGTIKISPKVVGV